MKVKKILALTLALLMGVSTATTSYASSLGGANAGGNTGSAGTDSGGGSGTTSNEKQGYRFTFINNATGERMSKTVDITRSDPDTISNLKSSSRSIIDDVEPTEWDYHVYSQIESLLASSVLEYNPTTDTMPWWYKESGGNYTGESEKFQQWLLSNEARENLSGGVTGEAYK